MDTVNSSPPAVVQGQDAFLKDLGDLLREHRGQWVAYAGPQRIEVGKTQESVYQRCLRRGYSEEEFVVLYVEPGAGAPTSLSHYPLLDTPG